MAGEAGKGDTSRPFSVDQKTFASNWDLIFNKGKQFPLETKENLKTAEKNTSNGTGDSVTKDK